MMARTMVALLLVVAGGTGTHQAGQIARTTLPAVGTTAPDFTLPDAQTGKRRNLREFSRARRPVALFFFCGCPACHAVAREWATYQRGNALPEKAATVIVYSTTDRAEAKSRAAASGLDPKLTAVLCDTENLHVTESLYHAEPCPRVVVLDPAGKVTYVNTGEGEKPQESAPQLLAARALSALREAIP